MALYAAETWTLALADRKRIEAFEMWIWRRMERISWTDKVSNEEVLQRVKAERQMLNATQIRKRRWIGHLLRHEGLLIDLLEGRMKGKRRPGRKRLQMLDDILENKHYAMLKAQAQDRCNWRLN